MKKMFLLATLITLAAGAAENDSVDWATEYADQAVAHQKMNIELKCGYSEERWHTDVDGHKLFAETVGKATAEAENKVREIAITQCRDAWEYAERGVSQNEDNIRRNCGKSGDMWHSDKLSHFTWAMQQTHYTIAIHDQYRRFSLSLCKS